MEWYPHINIYMCINLSSDQANMVTGWFSPGNIESDVDYGTLNQIIVTGPEAIYTEWKNCIEIASNLQAVHALDYGASSRSDILDSNKQIPLSGWKHIKHVHKMI